MKNISPFTFSTPRSKGIACAMFSVMVWSCWMIISGHGVRGSLSSFDIAALRFGISGLILMPVLFKKGLRIGPYGIWGGFILTALMGAPYSIIAIWGMKFAPISHAAGIINTTMLTLATLGSIFLLKEKTTKLRLLGLIISISGIMCLLDTASAHNPDDMMKGHMYFLIGGTMWGIFVLLIKKWKADAVHSTALVCTLSCFIYMPIYFAFIPSQIGMHNLNEVLFQGVFQGVINSIFAMMFYNRSVVLLGAATSSAFLPLVPAIATVAAIPFLGEVPNSLEITGIVLAAGGVLLSTGILQRIIGSRKADQV